MDGLNTLFNFKLKQALNINAEIQKMAEEVKTYEQEENTHRANMPAIFSVASFDSQTGNEELIFKNKVFFVKMLETIKYWSDKASQKIRVHNAELESIQQEVLMTV